MSTLIIVGETGRYFEVNLEDGKVIEVTADSDKDKYDAIKSKADSGTTIAELTPTVEADLASKTGTPGILGILGTFVNLKQLG